LIDIATITGLVSKLFKGKEEFFVEKVNCQLKYKHKLYVSCQSLYPVFILIKKER
jgi:hypothetical protein